MAAKSGKKPQKQQQQQLQQDAAPAAGNGHGKSRLVIMAAVGVAAIAVALAATPVPKTVLEMLGLGDVEDPDLAEDREAGFADDELNVTVSEWKKNHMNKALPPGALSKLRPPPEVEFMPAEMAATHEVTDAERIPYVKYLLDAPSKKPEQPMGVTFRNFYPHDLTIWWNNGTPEGVYSGSVRAGAISATNTYTTHEFYFRRRDTGEDVTSKRMVKGKNMVFLGPEEGDTATLESEKYKSAIKEREFREKYYEEHGTPWLSHYPPVKPVLTMWPADFVGQEHKLRSHVGYFLENGKQSTEPVDLTIRVVSVRPRVVVIENLLSPYEIEHIVELGRNVVRRSQVGSSSDGFQSDTRTSDNGWISRKKTLQMNTVYDRFADVLNMTDVQMSERSGGNIEQLQFVRYRKSQKYDPHHDFGYNGKPNQRFSTLFIYLQNAARGGATSFPKAFNGRGIKVKPPAGTAVLFYSMLEDGNGDDLSLHSGMPVEAGEKIAANLWSWTPTYR